MRHIVNSTAIIDLLEVHFEAVRPGIILYGYYPSENVLKDKLKLNPVISLKANKIHIKRVNKAKVIVKNKFAPVI